MAQADRTRILRLLPLVVGAIAGTLLMINRVTTPLLTDTQARSDAVGVLVCAILILTGLLWQQVQPRPPEAVTLIGTEGFELADDLPEPVQKELAWMSHTLLTNTVTRSLVVWYGDRVLLRRGILGSQSQVVPGTIVKRVLTTQKPVYLVNLNLYPGRVEFDYLPENTQGVICQPIGTAGVMILGANAPRSYTVQDENWIAAIAEKLEDTLAATLTTSDMKI
ncbi:MAG: cofactor assembly of complex C subunit B [Synechococcales cyanobacterium T60_A2020_003]|nr:cofactor assembly of complex C subunit B [Synechococcales cyanobacterium T60_A2020_003]